MIDYAHAKRFAERNTVLAGSQQQTNYSQEIAHEQNTFGRRINGMTIRQIFHKSFNEQRKPFRKNRCNTRTKQPLLELMAFMRNLPGEI